MMRYDTPNYRSSDLFGPLVPGRDCGGCTACCTYTNIDTAELKKPMGETCRHCTSSGCGIYAERFTVCRASHCMWRHVAQMPEASRSNESGLMFVLDQPDNPGNVLTRIYIRDIVTDVSKADNSALSIALLDMFRQGDLSVWLDDQSGELTLLHPSRDVADVLTGSAPERDDEHTHHALRWKNGVSSELPKSRT